MKTKILVLVFITGFCASLFAQTGIRNNGAKIIVTNGAIINITGGNTADFTNATNGTDGSIDLDGTIKLTGDWTNNATGGSVFVNKDTDGEVIFAGASEQTINGNQTDFEKLTLNNALGLTLNTSASVNGNIGLTSGRLVLGSNNLTLGSTSTVVGTPSASNMVVANGTGELRKNYSAIGSFLFPVGDNTVLSEYSPVTVNFTSGTFGSGAYAGVKLANAKHSQNTTTGSYINRYWSLSQNNISSFSSDITAMYKTADIVGTEANLYGAYWNGSQWVKTSAVNATSNYVYATLSSMTDITAGDQAMFCTATIVIDKVVSNVSCNGVGDGAINTTVSNGYGTISYNWATSDGSGLSVSAEDQTGLTPGTYNVTVTDQNGCTQNDLAAISEPSILSVIMSQTPDNGTTNGTATASVSGGTSPYNYLWDDALTQTTETATGLSNALYNVTISDDNGCLTYNSITVDFVTGITGLFNKVKISTFPNPVVEKLNISVLSDKSGIIQMNIFDEQGKLIDAKNVDMRIGENMYDLNTSSYTTGTYFVNIKSEKVQQIVKFVKSK